MQWNLPKPTPFGQEKIVGLPNSKIRWVKMYMKTRFGVDKLCKNSALYRCRFRQVPLWCIITAEIL